MTIYKKSEILKIGVPAVLESLLAAIVTSIDTQMISPLGKGAVSAVALTAQPKLLFFSIFFALGIAVSIFVSQAFGKRDKEEANTYFHWILRITILLSVVLGVVLSVLSDPVMRLFSRQTETLGMSIDFFRIVTGYMFFMAISTVLNAAMRAIGKTNVTLVAGVLSGVVDILLNYCLIEGHWGFPRLEIKGDAIATVAGTVASCVVSIVYLTRHSDFLSLRGFLTVWKRDIVIIKNIVSKSSHIIFENLFTRIGFLLSSMIVSCLSADSTAVYFTAMLLMNYTFAFGDGMQSTVVALTGRSIGAKQYDMFWRYVRSSRKAALLLSAALSAVYLMGAKWFYGLFFSDAESIAVGVEYTVCVAVIIFLQLTRIVNIAALRGLGEVKAPKRIAAVCVLIINPGVAFLLTIVYSYEVWGIWAASLISQAAWCMASYLTLNRKAGMLMQQAETPQNNIEL